jgi:hypothetical protein
VLGKEKAGKTSLIKALGKQSKNLKGSCPAAPLVTEKLEGVGVTVEEWLWLLSMSGETPCKRQQVNLPVFDFEGNNGKSLLFVE